MTRQEAAAKAREAWKQKVAKMSPDERVALLMKRRVWAAHARKVYWERVQRGELRFINVHYPQLYQIFYIRNRDQIELEESQVELEQFVAESRVVPSRAVKGRGYGDWAKRAFYAHLTVLKRIWKNYLDHIGDGYDLPAGLVFSVRSEEEELADLVLRANLHARETVIRAITDA